MPQTDQEQAALKAATDFWEQHNPANPSAFMSDLAVLILSQRAEAVEVARPEIERKARIEGLQLALQQVSPYQMNGEYNNEWVNARMQVRGKIDAEIARLNVHISSIVRRDISFLDELTPVEASLVINQFKIWKYGEDL